MYYLVYLTTNLVNNKMYVGVHKTYNDKDSYLGSGKAILDAIKKYGYKNFKKQILHYCLTEDDAYDWENLIVDTSFVSRTDTYNLRIGGRKIVLSEESKKILSQKTRENNQKRSPLTPEKKKIKGQKISEAYKNLSDADKQIRKEKQSKAKKGKPFSGIRNSVYTEKHRENHRQSTRRLIKVLEVITPDKDVLVVKGIYSELLSFCKNHNLAYTTIKKFIDKGLITNIGNPRKHIEAITNCLGWQIKTLYEPSEHKNDKKNRKNDNKCITYKLISPSKDTIYAKGLTLELSKICKELNLAKMTLIKHLNQGPIVKVDNKSNLKSINNCLGWEISTNY